MESTFGKTKCTATTTADSRHLLSNLSPHNDSKFDANQPPVSGLFKRKTVTESRRAEREFMSKTQAKFGHLVTSLNYDD
jgi:hypothetical protein